MSKHGNQCHLSANSGAWQESGLNVCTRIGTFRAEHILFAIWCGLVLASNAQAQNIQAKGRAVESTDRAIISFTDSVKPLLKQYCFECHGPDEQESELRLHALDPNLVEGTDGGQWQEVLDALNRGDMPPDDQSQPSSSERDTLVSWITSEINRAAVGIGIQDWQDG